MNYKLQKLIDLFHYDLPSFFLNIYRFRKSLWKYRSFDYCYNLDIFKTSLEITERNLNKYGSNSSERTVKICNKMQRAIEILNHVINDEYLEMAEKQLGREYITYVSKILEETSNSNKTLTMFMALTEEEEILNAEIVKTERKISEQEWNELFDILKGQDYEKFLKLYGNKSPEKQEGGYTRWFDGSGMRCWWN